MMQAEHGGDKGAVKCTALTTAIWQCNINVYILHFLPGSINEKQVVKEKEI
jgi:hypothetical protein